ncbi:MAG: RHS repeat domain-containing protein, partial [Chromatiales bacterium]
MRNPCHVFLAVVLSLSSYATAYGEEIRDYYAEPGLNPFKEAINQDLNEHIDPFAGTLQHKYVDVYVPGNGGLDLKVSRVYTSPQGALGVRTVTGAGWTVHFGRVVIPTDYKDTLCLQDRYAVSTKDNPSIEFPDGGRELLVFDAVHGTYLLTKSGWRAMCNGSGEGLIVTSPTGTVYTMDALNTLNNHWSWYTTNIRDRHGNAIDVSYKTNSSNFIYIDTVTASDGRQVKFEYLDEESATIRLDKITANEQTWTYRYESIEAIGPGYGDNYHNLTEVIRPDSLRWRYSYYPYTSLDAAGNYALKTVTYPYGANITYTYQHIDFTPADLSLDRTTAIGTKEVSGNPPGISVGPGSSLSSGLWRFEFTPHSPDLFLTDKGTWSSGLDKTTVRMPGGRQVYYHYGYSYTGGLSSGILWATGLLYKHETWDGCSADSCVGVSSTLLDVIYNDWEPRLISHENFWHGREGLDEDTYVPQLARKVHSRDDSGNEIRYEHYDAFGNAGRIIESSNLVGDPDKVTELSYYIDREKWILHQVEDETLLGANGEVVSHTDRSFNEDGDPIATDQNGVLTSYTYTAEGDLASATDARGSTTRFASYQRGIAQIEEHPESVTLTRVVNDTGTVASQTNGRGFSRHFTYDAMNRLTGITYPLNAPVSVAWDARGKTLTRGSYEERITLDGFGRVVSTTRADTALGISITQTIKYDVHGNKLFESYPNSEAGVSYAYDILKRPTTLQHPDGALRSYVYGGGEVTETDERGNTTAYLYRSFGDPDKDKILVQITAPNDLYTILDHNLLDLPIEVFQGQLNPADGSLSGYSRELSYDSRYFLTSVSDPETGVTAYGRDEVGNMISRQVGSSGVTAYTYDGLNRQVYADYPGTTPDVSTRYDADGHVTQIANGGSVIDYLYDENDNLKSQNLSIGAVLYPLAFTYDQHDFLSAMTYPSGRSIEYRPDALGRSTQVAPYVDAITYHPGGQLAQIHHANGELTDLTLDERQRIANLTHAGLADLGYTYDAIGNVTAITDGINPAEDRSFGYDGLNRLTSAEGRWGAGSFSYDTFGNLTSMALGADSHQFTYSGLKLQSVTHNNATRSWYGHDAYGNLRYDTEILGIGTSGSLLQDRQYVYDDSGRLRSVPVSQYLGSILSFSTHRFDYDAAGNRMRRTDPGGKVTRFLYGRTGQLLGEYTGAATYGKEYIYLGSQQVASARTNQAPEAQAGADRSVNG